MQPPQTRYAKARDGNQVAYQVLGEGPLDLVYLTGSLSNVDVRWEHPSSAQFLECLASFSRLVIFDRRGVGVSDRFPPEMIPTWEEWAEDLQVVLDAVDSRRAVLFAVADGGAMAITFAASHPDRIKALVLFHSLGTLSVQSEDDRAAVRELIASAEEELWGTAELVKFIAPSIEGDPAQVAWLAKYMRATMTPRRRCSPEVTVGGGGRLHPPISRRSDTGDAPVGIRHINDRIRSGTCRTDPRRPFVEFPGSTSSPSPKNLM